MTTDDGKLMEQKHYCIGCDKPLYPDEIAGAVCATCYKRETGDDYYLPSA